MDILQMFEEYLPRWSEEKHQPIPTKEHMDRWYIAWNDFIKEVMTPQWDTYKQEYLDMELKTHADDILEQQQVDLNQLQAELNKQQIVEPVEPIEVEQAKESDWEKVQRLLNGD